MTKIPDPHYTLIRTSRGTDPAVVVVNSALRNFSDWATFPWHLVVVISCRDVAQHGMPTASEVAILNRLEDSLSRVICRDDNALFLARITCSGSRELLFRIHDPEIASSQLGQLLSCPESQREWEYRLEEDMTWHLAEPELRLLEKDPRYS
jgi:hypothetical protein